MAQQLPVELKTRPSSNLPLHSPRLMLMLLLLLQVHGRHAMAPAAKACAPLIMSIWSMTMLPGAATLARMRPIQAMGDTPQSMTTSVMVRGTAGLMLVIGSGIAGSDREEGNSIWAFVAVTVVGLPACRLHVCLTVCLHVSLCGAPFAKGQSTQCMCQVGCAVLHKC